MGIPFCPLPLNRAKVVSKRFYGLAEFLSKVFPETSLDLKQAGMNMDSREYFGVAIFSSLFVFSTSFLALFLLGLRVAEPAKSAGMSLAFSFASLVLSFVYIKKYPNLLISRRLRDLEKNLLDALKHLYVQIKSGVPVFNALNSVALSNYGLVSEEFRDVVKRINVGTPTDIALDQSAVKTPSPYYRRIVWQISNGIKAGSDMGVVINSIIENMSAEQKILIRRYGSQLNPLTLIYMMFAVVIPSLGVTFLIILSSFSGLSVNETIFWMILLFLFVFQFMFIGLVKSRRPSIL